MKEPSVDITQGRSREYYRRASAVGEAMQDLHLDSDVVRKLSHAIVEFTSRAEVDAFKYGFDKALKLAKALAH